ncbi:MAG: glycosyltransferase [Elusimicrobiota bacterium]|jgi:rhamnosyltransferase|nr:glycosyltransferase [Elusimicrobiota bacterium]
MICAIIVSYNSDKVFRCFESIKAQADFIIIVDNATKDKNIILKLKQLANQNNKYKIVFNDENFGIGHALNQGFEIAKKLNAFWVITLDCDSQMPKDTILNVMKSYQKLPADIKNKTGLIALNFIDINLVQNFVKTKNENGFKQVKYALTSGNIIKMSAFEKTGCFNENLFIDQVDNDFDFRLRRKGFLILESCDNFILHELGQSQKKFGIVIKNYSPIRRYYLSRNCIYILKTYFCFDPYLCLKLFLRGVGGGFIKVLFLENDKYEKISKIMEGIFDGLRGRFGKKYNP